MGEEANLERRTVISGFLLAALPLLAGYGCRGKQDSPAVTPKAKGPALATTAAGQAGAALPKVTTSGSTIKISGSRSGDAKVAVEEGGYLIRYRYKGASLKMEVSSAFGALNMIPSGQSAGPDGWTELADLTSFSRARKQQYRITAQEPFEIQFVKLPLPTSPDLPPKTYSESGLKLVGPLSLKTGSATFRVNCPNLRQAGFIAELYDARTAQNKGIIALGTGTRVAETKKLQLASAGDYLIKVNANGRSEWTIEVEQ